jgi:hypothetical protein
MLNKRIRLKLLLLLVMAASAVGVGSSSTSAQCGYVQCLVIQQGGQTVGYACVSGNNFGTCFATVNGCRLQPCA